ncbi:hypothetical protein HMPREF9946_00184 [Acetobacteraceae bacterium AT-5844]|nr:hypothetical protein HMPREF9946_00184 [Acetobacteraceae bacterium AT-5844]
MFKSPSGEVHPQGFAQEHIAMPLLCSADIDALYHCWQAYSA